MRPVISSFSLAQVEPAPGDSSKPSGLPHRTEVAANPSADARLAVHAQSESFLIGSLAGGTMGNVLLIAHPELPLPQGKPFSSAVPAFGISMCLRQGGVQDGMPAQFAIECASDALPFQDESFRVVALYHVIGDGTEPELEEACRVLAPGGELLVVGLNRVSWAANTRHRHGPLPSIRHGKVLSRLKQLDMEVVAESGMGLLGGTKPRMERYRWSGLGLAFADLLLLRVKHRNRAIPCLPDLKKFPARAMPTSFMVQ